MLNWSKQFNIFCLLDNQQYTSNCNPLDDKHSTPAFETLLAVGCKASVEINASDAFKQLKDFSNEHANEWLFGHVGYDLKNETELLLSSNFDGVGFSDCFFFVPQIVLQLEINTLTILCNEDADVIYNNIQSCASNIFTIINDSPVIKTRLQRDEYLAIVKKIQQHILRGDCYELNFCQEFYAENTSIDPHFVYQQLTALSPNPFSAFYKNVDKYCLCASPERYLKKVGNKIISQPIKGTAKRNIVDVIQDEQSKTALLNSNKERSENVMVVDLVRNDLSKVSKEGTVKVDELFGIYSFPQVHQMISTVSGELKEEAHWVEIIKATFPMASMTGVPKKRVMELIEEFEITKRGLFSGSIGYVNPEGDFDFNVVIRSLLYNATSKYISFQTGSAITFNSDPEQEYEESLLKAAAIKQALQL